MSRLLTIACILGAVGVGLGAFGAHSLEERLESLETTAIYETATLYHLVHAVAMALAATLAAKQRLAGVASWLFLVGIVVFSGSLYTLAISGVRWWGAVTPIGGVAFIAGWIVFAIAAAKIR